MWTALPSELRRAILHHLSLVQLRMLKTLSRAMANHCRAVLRSKAWQAVAANYYALEEEIKTQLVSYKLPLTVSCFCRYFPNDAPCLATIHKLKLARLDGDGNLVTKRSAWGDKDMANENMSTIITDMCIEVHGYGICGSETTLRQVLQQAMRDRAIRFTDPPTGWSTRTDKMAKALFPFTVSQNPDPDAEDGLWSVTGLSNDQVPLNYILEEMCIAVEIRKGVWNTPDPPPSLQGGFDGWGFANPLNLCQLGSNLFCNK